MRINAIFAAALLFALPVSAQTTTPTPSTCNRAPHEAHAAASPQIMAARRNMHQACAADMAAYCSNVPRGCGAPKRCLMAHQSQLSQNCAAAWQNLRATRGGHS